MSRSISSIRSASKRSAGRAAIALAVVALLQAGPARADGDEDLGREGEAGLGIAAGLASLVYAPAKVIYAAGGGLVAGLAYVLSAGDQDVAEPILTPALRGDYVVTPSHLRGEKPLEFIGREPADSATSGASGAPGRSGDGLESMPAVSSSDPPTESR
jgi:hypothetical protein